MRASKALTAAGAARLAAGRRSRLVPSRPGPALLAGSACTRFGIFEAGQASARDPKYTVVPQRERIERGEIGRRLSRAAACDARVSGRSRTAARRGSTNSPITGGAAPDLAGQQQAAAGLGVGQQQQLVLAHRGSQVRADPVQVAPGAAADEAGGQRLPGRRPGRAPRPRRSPR